MQGLISEACVWSSGGKGEHGELSGCQVLSLTQDI